MTSILDRFTAPATPLPSLDDLLADERRIDLGPRFPLPVA